MKRTQIITAIQLLCRLGVGYIFIQSGLAKVDNLPEFYQAAQGYGILTPKLTHIYAYMLPYLEILFGGYFIIGLFTRFSAVANGGLTLSFLIAIAMVMIRGDAADVDCGCFVGGESKPVDWDLFYRDLLLLAACVFAGWFDKSKLSMDYLLSEEE